MMIIKLDELIKQKEAQEHRGISDTELAQNIGISRQTLAKIKNYHITHYCTTIDIIEKILEYFDCKSITELIEYQPIKKTE